MYHRHLRNILHHEIFNKMTDDKEWREWCQKMSNATATDAFIDGSYRWIRDFIVIIVGLILFWALVIP